MRLFRPMRLVRRVAPSLLVLAVAASCTLEAPTAPGLSIEETTFATSLGINLSAMTKTATGLYFQDAPVGTGAAAAKGNHVTVHYTGYLANGTVFDTSIGKSPFGFTLGADPREVIEGWEEGMLGMRIGGTRKLVIPAKLAYGPASFGSIPANSNLVFTVQLLSIP